MEPIRSSAEWKHQEAPGPKKYIDQDSQQNNFEDTTFMKLWNDILHLILTVDRLLLEIHSLQG